MDNIDGISIVIPYYEGKKYIEHTLKSLETSLVCAKLSYEILIVNDSPHDKIDFLVPKFSNLRIINNRNNMGIAASRNRGKADSKYKYIYLIDQDDWVEENFFIEALEYLKADYDFILFNYKINNNDTFERNYNFLFRFYLKVLDAELLFKFGNVFKTTGQIIIKRSLLPEFIGTKTMGSDDAYLFIHLFYFNSKKKFNFKYIENPLFIYRNHSDNYTKKTNFNRSSLECFNEYQKVNDGIRRYERLLKKRYNGDRYLNLMGKLIYKIITL